MVDEELAQFGVVGEPPGAVEFVPEVAPAAGPVVADRAGLAGFDRSGREPGLALGDVGPDEGGRFLALAVSSTGLILARQ